MLRLSPASGLFNENPVILNENLVIMDCISTKRCLPRKLGIYAWYIFEIVCKECSILRAETTQKLPATAACLCKCALKFGGLLFAGHKFYFILLFTFLTRPQNNPEELIVVYFLMPEYCQ